MNSNAKEAFSPEPSNQEKTSTSNHPDITRNTTEIQIVPFETPIPISYFRQELHIVGNKRAINRGLSNVVSGERNTLLKLELKGGQEA